MCAQSNNTEEHYEYVIDMSQREWPGFLGMFVGYLVGLAIIGVFGIDEVGVGIIVGLVCGSVGFMVGDSL